MKQIAYHTLFGIFVLALSAVFVACENTTTDTSDNRSEIATITVLDPPESGTRLPEIGETVSHSLSYSISDDYYSDSNTYRITAYFRATDSLVQVYQTTVPDQSDDSIEVSFAIPEGFPVTTTIETPYRLYFELTDETNGTLVLDESDDLVYDDWVFTGTWYGIDWKTDVTNTGFLVALYDHETNVYVNGNKGTIANKAGNRAEMTITHNWNGDSWTESSPQEGGTFYYALDGDTLINAIDEGFTKVFRLMTVEPTSYDEDYAGKWWTDEVTIEPTDNGILIYMSDTEFRVRRDDQNEYPEVERGTVAVSGDTLALTVTHTPIDVSGMTGFYTPVDPNDPIVQYSMTYTVFGENLTMTGTGGGDYADTDGIEYQRTQ